MKKFFLIIGLSIVLLLQSKAATILYPNVITNELSAIAFIQNYLLTNVTFISNVAYEVSTNNLIFTGSNFINILYVNGIVESTNAWAGPTNIVDLHIYSQFYKTVTPVSITGWTNEDPNYQGSAILDITNAATTNVTMTLASTVTTDDGARSYTITNGTLRVFSLRKSPLGITNQVSRTMF